MKRVLGLIFHRHWIAMVILFVTFAFSLYLAHMPIADQEIGSRVTLQSMGLTQAQAIERYAIPLPNGGYFPQTCYTREITLDDGDLNGVWYDQTWTTHSYDVMYNKDEQIRHSRHEAGVPFTLRSHEYVVGISCGGGNLYYPSCADESIVRITFDRGIWKHEIEETPVYSGAMMNALVYASVLYVPIILPLRVRRRVVLRSRRINGRCLHCNYDVAGLCVCPECGSGCEHAQARRD